jgi:lipoyl-dependent peroxiredoxin
MATTDACQIASKWSIEKEARIEMAPAQTPKRRTIERHRAERRADAAWTGSLFEGQGCVSVDSQAFTKLPITWVSRTGGHTDGATSPEELLAAAHASCFSMALSLVLAEADTPPEQLAVSATCALERRHDGFKITSVDLDVSGHVSGIDQHRFEEAVQRAAGVCPVSNALKSNVDMSWQAHLEY